MKFSESWLREWVDPKVSTARLLEQLTMAGLEVDGVEPAAPAFDSVVVAEVVAVDPHPDADRLRVTRVEVGEAEPLTVVTNVVDIAVGEKVALARVGCRLPDGMKIKRAKLRGVESYGMFCSWSTLGLAEPNDRLERLPLDAPVGASLWDYLGLDDRVIEVDLTPNRGDSLSLRGVAREVGVINDIMVSTPGTVAVTVESEVRFPVTVKSPAGCPRYLGRVIEGIDATATTPIWMVERLRRSGIRSLGPLVDVTNYVMIELGQPMHAFDLARIHGSIIVREAVAGERLVLLDGREVVLEAGTLLITDETGPLALAGILGGEKSGVQGETRDLFLECAFFAPEAVAGKARAFGLHTDSSHRYERGVDPLLQHRAMERATQLLLDIVGGRAGVVVEVVNPEYLPQARTIPLRSRRLRQVLGVELSPEWVEQRLQRLGMEVESTAEGWEVTPPSWRFDLTIEADLIEEMGRVHGYDRIPTTHPAWAAVVTADEPETVIPLRQLRSQLRDLGYHEVVTYSFVDPRISRVVDPDVEPLALSNPISAELSVMRTTLWSGLLQALDFNLKRQQGQIRLFETGLRFLPEAEGLRQQRVISGVICGDNEPEQWCVTQRKYDFFDLKGDVECLLGEGGDERFIATSQVTLHPGVSAQIERNGEPLGWLGKLHPAIAAELDLPTEIFLFELDLERLQQRKVSRFLPLSRFPLIRRDLAILLNNKISSAEVVATVRQVTDPALLREVRIFDRYQGESLASDEVSLAFGLFLQHDERTLTDEEVEGEVARILDALQQRHAAVPRR